MDGSDRPRHWPAYAVAVLFLGYAAGKAVFAWQARLGFPGGPAVPDAVRDGYFLDAATAQWFAAASGLLGAWVAIATVAAPGRRVPRPLMLLVLAAMLLAVGAGAAIMIVDGFIGIGVGWQWHHGVLGIVVIALLMAMIQSYVKATRHAVG
ncbi:hypothetical protein [Saccharopolyspora pogona]|uniref:hypothetical protein n=1 Tax=Saccharopolyspora pogona TaxID=333966 RepID=UPI0016858F6D|nr:hypothetical protein [Saccharopolyspora pogona]